MKKEKDKDNIANLPVPESNIKKVKIAKEDIDKMVGLQSTLNMKLMELGQLEEQFEQQKRQFINKIGVIREDMRIAGVNLGKKYKIDGVIEKFDEVNSEIHIRIK